MSILDLDPDDARLAAAREAVERLGLLTPEAIPSLAALLTAGEGQHPRATCTAYRKQGEPLSTETLKAWGIRANGFLSREAADEITEAGRVDPLRAHETSLLRAWFTLNRYRAVHRYEEVEKQLDLPASALSYSYDMLPPMCDGCKARDGTEISLREAAILAPSDCQCETANYGIRQKVDWLADLD